MPLVWETRVQFQIKSYQRLEKWYLMLPYLTLNIISRVKWSNPGDGVVPYPTPRWSGYWKGSPPLHLSVVAIEKGAFESPLTKVTKFTYFTYINLILALSNILWSLQDPKAKSNHSLCTISPLNVGDHSSHDLFHFCWFKQYLLLYHSYLSFYYSFLHLFPQTFQLVLPTVFKSVFSPFYSNQYTIWVWVLCSVS